MKERYYFFKKLFPNYLILFIKKGKIKYINDTKLILDIFPLDKIKNINILTIDNLEIIDKKECKNNEYELYLGKAKLINLLNEVKGVYKI